MLNTPKINTFFHRLRFTNLNQAEEQGILTPHSGDTIYEGTSGSTGISLATLARAKGYLAHMYVPSIQPTEPKLTRNQLHALRPGN